MLHEIEKTALVASPETGGRALDEPKVKNEMNPIRPFVFNKRPKRKPDSTTTKNNRPTPMGLASFAAAMLHRSERPYRLAGSLKTYPIDLLQTDQMLRNVTRNRKRRLLSHLPKPGGEP